MKVQKGITLSYETIQLVIEYIKDKNIDFSNFVEESLLIRIKKED